MTRLLVTGASGQLGAYLLKTLAQQGQEVIAWSGSRQGSLFGFPLREVNLTDLDALSPAFADTQADVVIHAAAMASVAECYRNVSRARQINVLATQQLASLCASTGARLVYVSTDLVFDGESAPYRELDTPQPLSIYGQTKHEGEQAALHCPGNVIARLSLLYGPSLTGSPNFFDQQRAALSGGAAVSLFADEWRTPLDLPTAARALLTLSGKNESGIFHLGGPERMSRLEMGQRLARWLGLDDRGLRPAYRADAPAPEPRPRDTALDSRRLTRLCPDLVFASFEQALELMR